jgi:hypothetical protein
VGGEMKNGKTIYIYLDQNKWIDLSRAYHNRQNGNEFIKVLQKLKTKLNNRVVLPLSIYHYIETQKIKSKPRKTRLAETMSILSSGWGITPIDEVNETEIKIAGANFFNFPPPLLPLVFKQSSAFTWGISLINIAKSTNDPLGMTEEFVNSFDQLMSQPQVVKMLLTGELLEDSRLEHSINGYKKGITYFAEATNYFRTEVIPDARSQLKHKHEYIFQIVKDLRGVINSSLEGYGKSVEDIISMGKDKIIEFIENIPTLDVEAELVSRRNVSWNRAIDENDWADIRFLTTAIPYCDIIVTEKYWKDLIQKSALDKKYNTKILSNLEELELYI